MSEANTENSSTLKRDLSGLLLIGFTLFAVVALMSYAPQDPSFNTVTSSTQPVKNLGGKIGACLADGLAQVFGAGAFFFPGITGLLGWAVIRGREFSRWKIVLGFGVLFLAGFCAWLNVRLTGDPWFGTSAHAGGMLGAYTGPPLVTWFNVIGAEILLSTLLFISLLAMFGVSVNDLVNALKAGGKALGKTLWEGVKSLGISMIQAWTALTARSGELWRIMKAAREERIKQKELIKEMEKEPVIITPALEERPQAPIKIIPRKKENIKPKKERTPKTEKVAFEQDLKFEETPGQYQKPPLDILNDPPEIEGLDEVREQIMINSGILERKLADFGIQGKVLQVLPGPVITLYEYEPAPGIKVSRILSLTDDLALAMRAPSVRILAPVPGKSVVGIELPNPKREMVTLKEVICSDAFDEANSCIAMAVGKDNIGHPIAQDLALVPHLLIAGSTGSGKSVGINSMICSILLNATPDEVKMIMIDPKMLELSMYDGIPHLIAPVVTNPKKAAAALQWAVAEMEARYKMMAEKGVRNVKGFNEMVDRLQKERDELLKQREEEAKQKKKNKAIKPNESVDIEAEASDEDEAEPLPEIPARLPYVVIVIDELADLMMVASKGVEDSLTRLAQMARAAGIHLIVATQRPSVDVLTGIIKANFPARMSFQVTSRVDSRTILDSVGAEKLLGKGDMLFLPPGTSHLKRIHGAMVSDEEINEILRFIKSQHKKPEYLEDVFEQVVEEEKQAAEDEEDYDEKYDEAVAIVAREKQASISMIQRRLRIGYNRAARIIEIMEREGVVGPSDGIKPREVYVSPIALE